MGKVGKGRSAAMAHLPLLCFIDIDLTQLFENSGNLREAPSPEQARMVVLVDNLVLPSPDFDNDSPNSLTRMRDPFN